MSFESVTVIYLVGALLSFVLTLISTGLTNAKITVSDFACGTVFAVASWVFLFIFVYMLIGRHQALIISKISKIGSITLMSFKKK